MASTTKETIKLVVYYRCLNQECGMLYEMHKVPRKCECGSVAFKKTALKRPTTERYGTIAGKRVMLKETI